MSYQNSIPLATDAMSTSQGDLQGNFLTLDSAWNVNHVQMNLPAQGKHHFIHIPNGIFGAAFPLVTGGNEVALYAESGNLYFRPASQAVGVHTLDQKLNMDVATGATNSVTFPNGIIHKWGTNSGSGTVYTPFPIIFPHECYSVQITTSTAGGNDAKAIAILKDIPAGGAGFNAKCVRRDEINDPRNTSFTWFAVGY